MRTKYPILIIAMAVVLTTAIVYAIREREDRKPQEEKKNKPTAIVSKASPQKKKTTQPKQKEKEEATLDTIYITGTLRDQHGQAMKDVVVSNGQQCTLTDSTGRYKLVNDKNSKFVYYTVPAYCEVPVHSATDNTACFYQEIRKDKNEYDFTLKRMERGAEKYYKMIVIGDPQVTNAFNPFYTSPNDNRIEQSDIERFTNETMKDIKRTISSLPADMPIYGLSMGDDVQYYGGYNPMLEKQIREALGSSKMRIFSVIGNHDQDGNAEYTRKWEESWGPTDYSFDRGSEHYVCFNNVQFHGKYKAYYSPGELTEKQMKWLIQDLKLTPKNKKVILCYHIPLTFGNSPFSKATPLKKASEEGHFSSSRLPELLNLLGEFSGGYELFCGHTHFAINHEIELNGQHIIEHCHAAACGNIWQSNINICGTPNGYYVYTFNGNHMASCYYKGTFWEARKQMTLFRADTDFNGESYAADWNLQRGKDIIVANIFNADSRWKITAKENGTEYPMQRIDSKGQDAFAAGYHHKYAEANSYRFISKENGYLIMNHLYYYEPKDPNAEITIIARDPYGHRFEETSSEAITAPFFNYAHYYK